MSTLTSFEKLSFRTWLALSSGMSLVSSAFAQEDFGGEVPDIAGTPDATTSDDIRDVITNALIFVLNFLALAAVVFIVIAGIRLIVSQGEEEQKDKAKKTILYVIIGLLVVLFARVIVGFFTSGVNDAF